MKIQTFQRDPSKTSHYQRRKGNLKNKEVDRLTTRKKGSPNRPTGRIKAKQKVDMLRNHDPDP